MRLPGSFHCRREPVLCELLELYSHPRYSRDEVVAAFGGPSKAAAPPARSLALVDGSIPEGERNSTLFQLAHAFVNKGFGPDQVLTRVQAVNATKCAVPLCATEVDAIVDSAVRHGPSGFLNLPLRIFDSAAYRQLSHAARTLAAAAYRRYNGENNGDIALSFSDFPFEFTRRETFYAARAELVNCGLLRRIRKRCYIGGVGSRPDLYEVALSPPSGTSQERSAVN
nr:primase alpha helix C-terminal domain-containing protein [Lysobacter enzymogenes]